MRLYETKFSLATARKDQLMALNIVSSNDKEFWHTVVCAPFLCRCALSLDTTVDWFLSYFKVTNCFFTKSI